MYSVDDTLKRVGFPIRTPPDQSLLATPRGFSQRATSFIASQCQGIHQMPFSCLRHRHAQKTGSPREVISLHAPQHFSRPQTVRPPKQPSDPRTKHIPICGVSPQLDHHFVIHNVKEPEKAKPSGPAGVPAAKSIRPYRPGLPERPKSGNLVELNGIEPMTSCLQSRRSPN